MAEPTQPMLVVVMGVSGSGKSTVGVVLADRLGVPFIDGDDLHPQSNVDKMHAGIPLTDADRRPWLARIGRALAEHEATGLVIVCSALKRAYRDAILAEEPRALFLHLSASFDVIAQRVAHRSGHFMPASLLQSQFETLEPLGGAEPGVVVDVAEDVAAVVRDSVARLRALRARLER